MKILAKIALFATIASSCAPAAAQPAASPTCPTPALMPQGRMQWFGGYSPSDDLLTAWCRLQTLPGSVKFNVLFPLTKVHKTWETSFQGANLPPNRIVEIIQSLLPTTVNAPENPDMAFYRVLENVVQAGAKKTPDDMDLGFTKSHPASHEMMLWEPVVLRVKPVVMAGQEFTLSVVLRPNLGMFALGQQKKATDVKFLGAKGRMNVGNRFTKACSSLFPYCDGLPDVVTFHAPWIVTGIRLDAEGENMTNTAIAIMNHLGLTQNQFLKGRDPLSNFNKSNGSGTMTLTDGISVMKIQATGQPGGTKKIAITWEEENNNKDSIAAYMRNLAISYRTSKKPSENVGPKNPDILNRL